MWIESVTVRRELAADPNEPAKPKEPRTLVYVTGQATTFAGSVASAQLGDFQTAIQVAHKGARVSIVEQRPAPSGGGVVEFRVMIDLLREGAQP